MVVAVVVVVIVVMVVVVVVVVAVVSPTAVSTEWLSRDNEVIFTC